MSTINIKRPILLSTVFLTGAFVLIIEVVAIRILAPYFGNTIFNYSSVITVILAALSVGYYTGGKVADKKPDFKLFYEIILCGGLGILLMQVVSENFLEGISRHFSLMIGPLVLAMMLFFIPAFLLGTLSPFAIKLLKVYVPDEGVGSISGKVFFWSTAGSILGSLAAGFVLIPRIGIDRIVVSVGIATTLLGLVAVVFLKEKKRVIIPALIVAALLSITTIDRLDNKKPHILYERDGTYEKLSIRRLQTPGGEIKIILLFQDLSPAGWMYENSDTHVVKYTQYYSLYKIFNPDAKDILAIGGGGYVVPKSYYNEIPDSTIDVAEIEPKLFDLGKKYFRVPTNDRLRNHIEDGRRFLHDSKKKYDVIYSDAYFSFATIPPHLVTKEFFELAKSKLNDKGIFIGNFYGDLTKRPKSLIYSVMKTFKSVFDNSYFFAVKSPTLNDMQNIMFVGYNSDKHIDIKDLDLGKYNDDLISSLPYKLIDTSDIDFSKYPLFTDNYSPAEYFTAISLRYLPKFR